MPSNNWNLIIILKQSWRIERREERREKERKERGERREEERETERERLGTRGKEKGEGEAQRQRERNGPDYTKLKSTHEPTICAGWLRAITVWLFWREGGRGGFRLKGDFIRPDQLCLPSSFILGYQFKEEEEEKRSQLSDVTCSPPRIYPWAESENLSFQSVLSIALKTNLFIKNQIRQGWGRGKHNKSMCFFWRRASILL